MSVHDNPTGRLVDLLANAEGARLWLADLGFRDPARGHRDLLDLAGRVGSPALVGPLMVQLDAILTHCPDPDMALSNLDRFVAAHRDPSAAMATLRRSQKSTEGLIQVFSTSQYFSELIIRDPLVFDWLRTGGERRDRDGLFELLWAELLAAPADGSQGDILRRFRHRQMLRIGYNDIVRGLPLEIITQDLSNLAEACVEASSRIARARAVSRHGEARGPDGRPLRFAVLALGKLGGAELNYSSDIDLIFLYEAEGKTAGPNVVTNAEFFARMGAEIVRILSDHTAMGQAYRVDMRLRPDGDQGPLARSLPATIGYYETSGRTWERQALIKCRPIAGDLSLGREFLASIDPFVYRTYLGASEIGEIKAMKRRIELRTTSVGADEVEVKTGRGGIRDVEFVVQFLQLLHGGREPRVRHPNTLVAMDRLEEVGCLSAEERGVMEDTYRFLRKVEHRLQTMFDRQTHQMPRGPEERRTLAIRLGYPPASAWEDRTGPAYRFESDYRRKTDLNRRILNHLLHDAFRDDDQDSDPVVDLVLDPDPSPEQITEALGKYAFRDSHLAYCSLMALAREDIEFLSQPRCRHFLAAIAPSLLRAVAATPDPDLTLTNLEKVSASLGAKAILWELFSLNPPSLRLYVELCSTSQFLSEILVNNPGMIDDLIDSLVVDRPAPASSIRSELSELCRGAEDLSPILLSFRNKEWLRIGTRDILGREPIRDVTRELADVAEAIVGQVARAEWSERLETVGVPRRSSDGRRCRWAILALGKLGGREMTYHSDLDLVFLYDEDGQTRGVEPIPNSEFFAEIARRVIRRIEGSGGSFALYKVDTRLRPYGNSGPLAVTLDGFRAYFQGAAQVWERMALTRARIVHAQGTFGRDVSATLASILCQPLDANRLAGQVAALRRKVVGKRGLHDLKRTPGGLVDVEFLVQYLLLTYGAAEPDVLRPNLWDALDAMKHRGVLEPADHLTLREAYDFYREAEARLRIVHNRTDVCLPNDPDSLGRLACRLNYEPGQPAEALRRDAAKHASAVRSLFDRIIHDPATQSSNSREGNAHGRSRHGFES